MFFFFFAESFKTIVVVTFAIAMGLIQNTSLSKTTKKWTCAGWPTFPEKKDNTETLPPW